MNYSFLWKFKCLHIGIFVLVQFFPEYQLYFELCSVLFPAPFVNRHITKCIHVLLYGLEALQLNKSQISSIDFVINRFFMKMFNTNNIEIVQYCQQEFCFSLPSVTLARRTENF